MQRRRGDELLRDLDRVRAEELDLAHARARPARVTSLALTWALGWLRPPTRAKVEPLPDVLPGEVALTFGGHATLLVRYARTAIVCDPMLGGRLGPVRRAEAPGLAPGELEDVRLVLVSQGHPGHLHPPTLRQLPRRATLVVPRGLASAARALGFAHALELGPGEKLAAHDVEVHAERVPGGGTAYVLVGDGPRVLHCGAAAYGSAFRVIGQAHRPDVACLPIGGYVPRSFRRRHMSPLDALAAFEDLGARMFLPLHHGAFALSYERLGEPRRWLEELVRARGLEEWVTVLAAGGSRAFR